MNINQIYQNTAPAKPEIPKGPVRRRGKYAAIIVAGIFVLIWMIIGAGFLAVWVSSQFAEKNVIQEPAFDGNSVVAPDETDLASIAKKVSPSVVSIVTRQTSGSGYFQQDMQGAGTGIIISKDGYVLTNKHVVNATRSVQIVASDGTRYENVKMVGADPLNDLAFLKIEGVSDLPVAEIGDSGTVRVGQRVLAIGNSLGQYQNTVTSGIISGLGRPVTAASDSSGTSVESLTDLLQTDAAINPGNSGGPLINVAGQVIGINTAIVSDAQSIGFAIPINASKGLMRGVLADGKIKKAYIGVQYVAITPDVRAERDLSEKQGALVSAGRSGSAIVKGGPADKAGIRDGDIIIKVNQQTIGEHGGLGSLVAEFLPGENVTLTIVRSGKTQELQLVLGEYKS